MFVEIKYNNIPSIKNNVRKCSEFVVSVLKYFVSRFIENVLISKYRLYRKK